MMPSDKPSDDIINNDADCDKWFDQYLRKQAISGAKGNKIPGSQFAQGNDPFKVIPIFKDGNAKGNTED